MLLGKGQQPHVHSRYGSLKVSVSSSVRDHIYETTTLMAAEQVNQRLEAMRRDCDES